jgi:hypothetical protein
VTGGKFNRQGPEILDTTVQHAIARATLHFGFCAPLSRVGSELTAHLYPPANVEVKNGVGTSTSNSFLGDNGFH